MLSIQQSSTEKSENLMTLMMQMQQNEIKRLKSYEDQYQQHTAPVPRAPEILPAGDSDADITNDFAFM